MPRIVQFVICFVVVGLCYFAYRQYVWDLNRLRVARDSLVARFNRYTALKRKKTRLSRKRFSNVSRTQLPEQRVIRNFSNSEALEKRLVASGSIGVAKHEDAAPGGKWLTWIGSEEGNIRQYLQFTCSVHFASLLGRSLNLLPIAAAGAHKQDAPLTRKYWTDYVVTPHPDVIVRKVSADFLYSKNSPPKFLAGSLSIMRKDAACPASRKECGICKMHPRMNMCKLPKDLKDETSMVAAARSVRHQELIIVNVPSSNSASGYEKCFDTGLKFNEEFSAFVGKAMHRLFGGNATFMATHLRRGDRCSEAHASRRRKRGSCEDMSFYVSALQEFTTTRRLPVYVATDETRANELKLLRAAGFKTRQDLLSILVTQGMDSRNNFELFLVEVAIMLRAKLFLRAREESGLDVLVLKERKRRGTSFKWLHD